ncbi:MAG: hypothetical protein RRB13_00985 [bacterium]|nr:hypothetical protein [bacterium]
MRLTIWSFLVLLLCSVTPLRAADDLFIGVQTPMDFSFSPADDGNSFQADGAPTGLLLSASLPVLGGVSFETYEVKLKNQGEHKFSYLLVDYFYTFPLPFVNLSMGAGAGTVNLKGDYAGQYDRGTALQFLARLGIPITVGFNLDFSYHVVQAELKYLSGSEYLEAGGTMWALGASIGF